MVNLLKFGLRGSVFAGILAAALPAGAITITFDTDAGGSPLVAPSAFGLTIPLTTLYTPLGVTFSGVNGVSGSILNVGSNFGIGTVSGDNFLAFNDFSTATIERIDFANPQASVDLFVGVGNGNSSTFTLRAFDSGDNQLAIDSATPGDGIYAHLFVTNPNIAYVTVATEGPTMVIDDLTFNATVPEPASLALLGAGLVSLGAVRRRRKA